MDRNGAANTLREWFQGTAAIPADELQAAVTLAIAALEFPLAHVEDITHEALMVEAAHHKQWYLIHLAHALDMTTDEYEQGIAP